MACSRCGAAVDALEATCPACGAELRTPPRVPFPPAEGNVPSPGDGAGPDPAPAVSFGPATPPPAPPAPASSTTTTAVANPVGRSRGNRWAKVLALVACMSILAAVAAGVSRSQVVGELSTTRSALRDTSSLLSDAEDRADAMERRVHDVEGESEQLRTEAADAQARSRDVGQSLDACQDLFRIVSRFANPAAVPSSVAARAYSKLVSCFEGKVPPSIWR